MGPLLFILYINDITACSKYLHFILFADDTNLVISADSWEKLVASLNAELIKLSNWFIVNKLSLNVKKTNYIIFGKKKIENNSLKIKIDNQELVQVESTKFLGVLIYNKLNWKKHNDFVINKIAKI